MWTVYIARMGDTRCGYKWGNVCDSDRLGYLGLDGRIILKCIFKECDGGCTGLTRPGTGIDGGCLCCGKKLPDFI
jgi:hypothetical protein